MSVSLSYTFPKALRCILFLRTYLKDAPKDGGYTNKNVLAERLWM